MWVGVSVVAVPSKAEHLNHSVGAEVLVWRKASIVIVDALLTRVGEIIWAMRMMRVLPRWPVIVVWRLGQHQVEKNGCRKQP